MSGKYTWENFSKLAEDEKEYIIDIAKEMAHEINGVAWKGNDNIFERGWILKAMFAKDKFSK